MLDTLHIRMSDIVKDVKEALEKRTNTMAKQTDRRNLYKRSFAMQAWSEQSHHPCGSENVLGGQAVSVVRDNSRMAAITAIQQKIGEIASMSEKMAIEVTKHEELIQRIDGDVKAAGTHVDDARE